jgi:hypothetical protein
MTALFMTLKLISVSFCYKDGSDEITNHDKVFNSYQKKYILVDKPTFLEYFSFSFTLVGCMGGPFIEFKEYCDFMNKQGKYSNLQKTPNPIK